MTESASASASSEMTIDIRPMIEDVSQVMTRHITNILSGVIGEYTIYKETHDTIMNLPCVRRLQERIVALEVYHQQQTPPSTTPSTTGGLTGGGGGASREDEIAQLQRAIADLNRYIHALESKVDVKTVLENHNDIHNPNEEESVRLEIQEQDPEDDEEEEDSTDNTIVTTTHKNVVISSEALVPVDEEESEEDPEAAAEAELQAEALLDAEAQPEDAVEDAEAEEAEAEEE